MQVQKELTENTIQDMRDVFVKKKQEGTTRCSAISEIKAFIDVGGSFSWSMEAKTGLVTFLLMIPAVIEILSKNIAGDLSLNVLMFLILMVLSVQTICYLSCRRIFYSIKEIKEVGGWSNWINQNNNRDLSVVEKRKQQLKYYGLSWLQDEKKITLRDMVVLKEKLSNMK